MTTHHLAGYFQRTQGWNPESAEDNRLRTPMGTGYITEWQYKEVRDSAHFGSTYAKTGTIQRGLAWPLPKDEMQIREAFHICYTD